MPSAVAGSNCGHIYMPSAPRELTVIGREKNLSAHRTDAEIFNYSLTMRYLDPSCLFKSSASSTVGK